MPLARKYAEEGYNVILAARNVERIASDAKDIRIRFGHNVKVIEFDLLKTETHSRFIDGLEELPDTVISLIGLMTPQLDAQINFDAAELMIKTNYLGLVSILGE